jgi:hypothetical protein
LQGVVPLQSAKRDDPIRPLLEMRGKLNFKRGTLEGHTEKQLHLTASPSKGGL